jgi:3-deoxy-manno-octulosonate cytidylyltransferase (CMP-KDO synthetase)
VIPARYASTRFPGKPLADLGGRPLIEHVYRRVTECRLIGTVIVATDDARIQETVTGFGGRAQMTHADHVSGTDRVAEVARGLDCDLVVNVQGDEPLIAPDMIEDALTPFADPAVHVTTLRRRIDDPADYLDPHVCKVVVDRAGHALYFSRTPIPYRRDCGAALEAWKHVGLYAYRRKCLLDFARMTGQVHPSSPAASCRRSARAWRPPRSAACWRATATGWRCRSSTRTSTSTPAR